MTDSTELLVLRLVLIGIIFFFVLAVALTMRSGVTINAPRAVRATRRPVAGPRLVLEGVAQTSLPVGAEFAVAGTMTLGRDPDGSIVLPDPSVSARHAAIERTAAGWRITDLGSTNGTTVNGRPVDGRGVALRGGERVAVGAVVLRFQA